MNPIIRAGVELLIILGHRGPPGPYFDELNGAIIVGRVIDFPQGDCE